MFAPQCHDWETLLVTKLHWLGLERAFATLNVEEGSASKRWAAERRVRGEVPFPRASETGSRSGGGLWMQSGTLAKTWLRTAMAKHVG